MTNPIRVTTEKGYRIVTSKEEAKQMIKATAYSTQATHEELKAFVQVQRLALQFGLDTDTLIIQDNLNKEDHFHGYMHIYAWPTLPAGEVSQ